MNFYNLFLFPVLPRLKEHCSNRAMPLEDLLSEKGYDKILDFIGTLENIGDLKVGMLLLILNISSWF